MNALAGRPPPFCFSILLLCCCSSLLARHSCSAFLSSTTTSPSPPIAAAAATAAVFERNCRSPSSSARKAVAETAQQNASSTHPRADTVATTKTTTNNRTWLLEFNQGLNVLAEQAGDPQQPSIARAAACEAAWKQSCLELEQSGTHQQRPDQVSFNTVLKAWSRCAHCLSEHRQLQTQRSRSTTLDVPVYSARDAALRATELLQQQIEHVETGHGSAGNNTPCCSQIVPDLYSYNIVMDAWSKSRTREATTKITDLMSAMKHSSAEEGGGLEPDSLSYNALVDAFAYSNHPDRIHQLNRIWKHMENLRDSAGSTVRPTTRTLNSILHAYSRRIGDILADGSKKDKQEAAAAAERAAKLAARAEEQLRSQDKLYETTKDPADELDAMTYTTVMDAYARCGTLDASQKAEILFAELKERHKMYQEISQKMEPDGDKKSISSKHYERKNRYRPTAHTYTTLILAWARTLVPRQVNPQPSVRGDELLEEMIEDLTPSQLNHRPFTGAMRCWSRSRDNRKAGVCLKLLQRMKQLAKEHDQPAISPSLASYNTAIDACSRTRGTGEQQTAALKIAFAVFKAASMDPNIVPNHVTFSNLLKCAEFLVPIGDERNKIATSVFDKACAAGQVDASVLRTLKRALDANLFLSITKEMQTAKGFVTYDRIPNAWCKNV